MACTQLESKNTSSRCATTEKLMNRLSHFETLPGKSKKEMQRKASCQNKKIAHRGSKLLAQCYDDVIVNQDEVTIQSRQKALLGDQNDNANTAEAHPIRLN